MGHKEEKVVSLGIIFENCEFVSIPIEYVKHLIISDITKTVLVNCFQYKSGETITYNYCDNISFLLDTKLVNEPIKTNFSEYLDVITYGERLSHNDITSIELIYNDGLKEEYHVYWGDGSEYQNNCQSVKIDENEFNIKIDRVRNK